ncbi:MAG: hypothetical protein ACSHYF_06620 [Verrucomicrobiaceae bacterium]
MWKICALLAPLSLHAVTPGAKEEFPTETNASAWGLFDFADGITYAPNWVDGDDPYAGSAFAENPESPGVYDQGLWFFADDLVAEGAFVGDYHAAKIAGVEVDVFISEPEKLDFCDIALLSNAGGENVYYYSVDFPGTSFLPYDGDWWLIPVTFGGSWFIRNSSDIYVPADLTPEILSNVVEIGIRFFPTNTNDEGWAPLIDNFSLTPTPEAPEITTSAVAGNFNLGFTPKAGNYYSIEKFNRGTQSWEDVAGQTEIFTSAPYNFESTLIPEGEFYRVLAKAAYTPVISPEVAN